MSDSTFENPYNFVPAPPRNTAHAELGDHAPAGHHRYHPDHVSGTIDIELQTVTPLLIPDEGQEQNGHKTFGLRLDARGAPHLPPTSLKGMLRAAFEAVTNSRFAVFQGHDERLGYRPPAKSALGLIPCRIVRLRSTQTGVESNYIELLTGISKIGKGGAPYRVNPTRFDPEKDSPLYAAWLRRYDRGSMARDRGESVAATRYPDGSLPAHGDHVWVKVEEKVHRNNFKYLQVTEIRKEKPEQKGWYEGWVYVSGPNIDRKHDEKVFLRCVSSPIRFELQKEVEAQWQTLICNYRAQHEKDLKERETRHVAPGDFLGTEPGKTAFSRHIYGKDAEKLKPGTLAYARVSTEQTGEAWKVTGVLALYPVAISRELFAVAPHALLHPTLLPATALSQLSPADRVFGWVNQNGHGAFRGQLRIGHIRCEQGDGAVERQPADGVPLAILAAPKPQQARFYGAQDKNGTPFANGKPKDQLWSSADHGLRGRKVYPHHAILDRLSEAQKRAYWTDNGGRVEVVASVGGRPLYREWLRLENEKIRRDDQNRSVTAWVKPGTVFTARLHLTNLSRVEAGALLWLLSLPEDHCHRLGGGKPLGFGSVRIRIRGCRLHDGAALATHYQSFGAGATAELDHQELVAAFRRALLEAYPPTRATASPAAENALAADLARAAITGSPKAPDIEAIPFIRAFLNACRGGRLPVHYPRTGLAPDPEGKQYEWFVENESTQQNRLLHAYALPAGWQDRRDLPYLGGDHGRGNGGQRGNRNPRGRQDGRTATRPEAGTGASRKSR